MAKPHILAQGKATLSGIVTACFLTCAQSAWATAEDALLDLPLEELLQIQVSTASKFPEAWSEAASTMSVITAADLRKMGARSIFDALASVPGIAVDYNGRNTPAVDVRGFRDTPLLYLLNGQSLSGVVSGGAQNIGTVALPISNIERIEVVRGPGSALYGANALIGIVNIITKADRADSVNLGSSTELQSGGRVEQRVSIQTHAHLTSELMLHLNLESLDRQGARRWLKADADGNSGYGDNAADAVDVQADVRWRRSKLFVRYNRYQRGDFLGLTDYLNHEGEESAESIYLNGHQDLQLTHQFKVSLSAYYDKRDVDWFWTFFPAGSGLTQAGGPFADWYNQGLKSDLLWREQKAGVDVLGVYEGLARHTLVLGLAHENQRSYDIKHLSTQNPGPLAELTDVSAEFNWNQPGTRDINAVYATDTWQLTRDLKTVIGARYDHYSDFGGAFNPRLSLVWQMSDTYSLRAGYGKAFRAPDFGDLYAQNLFGANGNPDIKPEKMQTFELGINANLSKRLFARATWFDSGLKDLIVSSELTQNRGSSAAQGIETEIRFEITDSQTLSGTYTYTDSSTNKQPFPLVARHRATLAYNWMLNEKFNFNLNANFIGQLNPSAPGQAAPPGRRLLNASVNMTSLLPGLDADLTLYNLTGTHYAYPSASLATGYPGPERSLLLNLHLQF